MAVPSRSLLGRLLFFLSLIVTLTSAVALPQASSKAANPTAASSNAAVPTSAASNAAVPVPIPSNAAVAVPASLNSSASSNSILLAAPAAATIVGTVTVKSTILVFARDQASSYSATSGLNNYGIPYQLVLVPQAGITLPALNSSPTQGNYGGIIILSEVSYQFADGWYSALTPAQLQQLYDYQTAFGVRMVRLDVYPTSDFGATTAIPGAGCCDSGVEQLVSFTSNTQFPTANLKTGAGVSTQGLWHYPATITDAATTVQIAQFAAGGPFSTATTAAVINTFGSRQQMVWFISWATEWSMTSNYLMHAHIHWMTRGLFIGQRRVHFSTQVDDVHLMTDLYQPAGATFRLRPSDLNAHVTWQTSLNTRLPAGSTYFMELAHNGNGNIEWAINNDNNGICNPPDPIDYPWPNDTPLEFQKPLGTGTSLWPTTPASFTWSTSCMQLDTLGAWFMSATNRNRFAHLTHTFTHLPENNATGSDVTKEIQFNQVWMQRIGLTSATRYSPKGIVPPAITGLHNGDAIQAWMNNGIQYAVGDNSRPVLLNTQNEHWPLVTNVADNGYAGLNVIPRWSNPIYYNCDTADCTTAEWIATSGGSGDFNNLLAFSRSTYVRNLLRLRHDGFMLHQANLRRGDVPFFMVGPVSGNLSLLQIFVETLVQELMRLTTWPIISLKHDDLGVKFTNRMTRDQCNPQLSYTVTNSGITGATLTSNGNTCAVSIPVQFPGTASATGATSEKLGSDPLTLWAKPAGSPITFTLGATIPL